MNDKYFKRTKEQMVFSSASLKVSLVSVSKEEGKNGERHLNLTAKKCNPPRGEALEISGGEELLEEINPNNHYQIWIKRESVTRFIEGLFKILKSAQWNEFEKSDVILSILKNKNLNSPDLKTFTEFLNNQENFGDLAKTLQSLQNIDESSNQNLNLATNLKILEENLKKITYFIDNKSSETEIQKWIDEDGHKNRRARCMIFGLEYVDHKREGSISGDKYDLLTRIGVGDENEERVLIELKGAGADVFVKKSKENPNGGISEEYSLSDKLSRAIPQILGYKNYLESASEKDLKRMGEKEMVISKCIIVIGKKIDDDIWKQNFLDLKKSFNSILEIWTYTDLKNKLSSTIENLKYKEESPEIDEK